MTPKLRVFVGAMTTALTLLLGAWALAEGSSVVGAALVGAGVYRGVVLRRQLAAARGSAADD